MVETEDGRRIVIEAADVLTVLKRERKPREAQSQAPSETFVDDAASEELPPDLAKLEDTMLGDVVERDTEFLGRDDTAADNADDEPL
jgi:hypothetical protein